MYRRILVLLFFLCAAVLLAAAARDEVALKQGETYTYPKTQLQIEVVKVQDLTGKGCMGGPRGCTDLAELKLTLEKESGDVTLIIPKTEDEKKQKVGQTEFHNHVISLVSVSNDQATLTIEVQ
jgi:hypothetical protein